jgi:formylglycine-generating enzyme required for sulfatase activity
LTLFPFPLTRPQIRRAKISLFLLRFALPVLAAPDWNTLNRAIVKVEAAKKPAADVGAGIVIAASSDSIRILTSAHVVADATALQVYFYSDQAAAYTATVLPRSSDALDLAVLEVRPQGRALPRNIPQLTVHDRNKLRQGDHIWTIDNGWRPVPNNVVALDHDADPQQFEYTKGSVSEGFSGGAVFDDDGQLVGIHRGGVEGGQFVFAVKLDSAIDALTALGHNTPNLVRAGTVTSTTGILPTPPAPQSAPRAGETRVNSKDGLTYVWIPPGSFMMGCLQGEMAGELKCSERDSHAEQIANGFWVGQTEVTQAAWKRVMNNNPSKFEGDQLPVENVDWNEASAYCKAIGGRLPTEKEWEYAARGGTKGARYGALDTIAWYSDNSGGKTHGVGLKQPNAYDLYDTLGNVTEWTTGIFAYDPQEKVGRGGSWRDEAGGVRAWYRYGYGPFGLRCVGEFR